jgi:hypothetical protein
LLPEPPAKFKKFRESRIAKLMYHCAYTSCINCIGGVGWALIRSTKELMPQEHRKVWKRKCNETVGLFLKSWVVLIGLVFTVLTN